MAKISAYTELTSPASGDLVPIVDVSDTSMAASGTTKYIQYSNMQTADITTAPTISSGTTVPSSTPGKVGDIYCDTTNNVVYVALGSTDSDDWFQLGSGSGSGASYGVDAPTSTPTTIGDFYINTSTSHLYVAVGTTDSDDWELLNPTLQIPQIVEFTYEEDFTDELTTPPWRPSVAGTLVKSVIWVETAPTNGVITVDLLKDGTTVYTGGTARPEIAISGKYDESGAPSITAMAGPAEEFQFQVKELHASDQGNVGRLMCALYWTIDVS